LVDLFELYDDARTYKLQMSVIYLLQGSVLLGLS